MLSAVAGFIQSRAIVILLSVLAVSASLLGYTRWQNERLREQNTVLEQNANVLNKQLQDAQQAVVAAEAAGERRQSDRDALVDIERAIREEEITAQCINSPAVQRVLGSIRRRRSNVSITDLEEDDEPD